MDRTAIGRMVPSSGDGRKPAWMPIEAHYPTEVYERLVLTRRGGDVEAAARAGNEFENSILGAAAAMRQKYAGVSGLADVAIMFLPVEGLYAEVLQRPALCQSLHRDYRVLVASPGTLDGLLADTRTHNQSSAPKFRP